MKISDERCFMLYCNLTAARENDITVYLNRQSVQGAPYDDITISAVITKNGKPGKVA